MNFQPSNPPALNPVTNCASSALSSSWHIPQSGRSSNGADFFSLFPSNLFKLEYRNQYNISSSLGTGSSQNPPNQNPLSMQFCTNGRLNENSFKIALKPQNTLKQTSHNQTSSAAAAASIGSVPSTVTSTNPKTPSPRTHDVRFQYINPYKY